jgi:PhnB protein
MKEINAYLIFNGNCREAMTFYQNCLGADLQLVKFSDMPGNVPAEAKDRIAHARLTKGVSVLMASDNMPGMTFNPGDNYFVSLQCETVQETDQLFSALSEKGKTIQPPQETPWAKRFAMFTDQFGTKWMLNCAKHGQ